jgi:hypothetical protein
MREGASDAAKRSYASLNTGGQPRDAGDERMSIDFDSDQAQSPPRTKSSKRSQAPLQEPNFESPAPSNVALNEPISYEPMRKIDMSTISAPKRFYRTFWRGLAIRTMSLDREGAERN